MVTLLKFGVALLLSGLATHASCQTEIPWKENYQLTFEDFQSKQTKVDPSKTSFFIQPGMTIGFSFMMTNYEFMFTKNFNSKVNTVFNKSLATISAPDTVTVNYLLDYARYSFDLHELYARRFRQQIFQKKSAFSDAVFFQPIFDQLHQEMSAENSRVLDETQFGANRQRLILEHQKVRIQLLELSDFCLDCKPPKKKK